MTFGLVQTLISSGGAFEGTSISDLCAIVSKIKSGRGGGGGQGRTDWVAEEMDFPSARSN